MSSTNINTFYSVEETWINDFHILGIIECTSLAINTHKEALKKVSVHKLEKVIMNEPHARKNFSEMLVLTSKYKITSQKLLTPKVPLALWGPKCNFE